MGRVILYTQISITGSTSWENETLLQSFNLSNTIWNLRYVFTLQPALLQEAMKTISKICVFLIVSVLIN